MYQNTHQKIISTILKEIGLTDTQGVLHGFKINNNIAVSLETKKYRDFFINKVVKNYLAANLRVSIIDVNNSYKHTCDLFSGQYIEITNKKHICINPFSFLTLDLNADSQIDDFHANNYQLTQLVQLFLLSAEIMECDSQYKLAAKLFEQAIISSLKSYPNTSTFTTVHEKLMEIIDSTGLAKRIKIYTINGLLGSYFEGPANINFDSNFVVYGISEFRNLPIFQFLVLLILMFKIQQDMSPRHSSICIISEAAIMMTSDNHHSFIELIYRTTRLNDGVMV